MDIYGRINTVKEKIAQAAERSDRSPEEISLMAVSKTVARPRILEAYDAGIRLFGENRIPEALEKFEGFPTDARLEMIGHLQSNKAPKIPGFFNGVQSIDSIKIAHVLNRCASEKGVPLDILIEVNLSGEETKQGFSNFELLSEAVAVILELSHLKLRGLMTMAPFTKEEPLLRKTFSRCRQFNEKLKECFPNWQGETLSMGMTNDYEIAVEEGSTLLRIGSAIFGERF